MRLPAKRKKPRFPAEGGAEGYLRHSAEGFPSSAPKQFGSRRTGSACQIRKKPEEGCRVLFGYPSSLLDGERRPQGVAKRPPLPAEMSDVLSVTSNATIVCSIPDSLIRLSLPTPRAAIGVAAGAFPCRRDSGRDRERRFLGSATFHRGLTARGAAASVEAS
jgi:hypothetical protein